LARDAGKEPLRLLLLCLLINTQQQKRDTNKKDPFIQMAGKGAKDREQEKIENRER